MVTKSQEELEQPIKGYQLEAVAKEVLDLKKSTGKRFDDVDRKLDTLISKNAATCEYVDKKIDEVKTEVYETIDLKYGPRMNNLKWFYRAVVVGVIGIVTQIIIIYAKLGDKL